jgi:hypothetical protein
MGFSDLWVLFDAESAETKRNINKHMCCDNLTPNNPWLVLDLSNIVYGVARLSGGNYRMFERYSEAFWRAIYFSKFKIMVVKDGPHNGERGVIKLHRMMQKSRYLDPHREEDVTDNSLFYECSEIRRRVRDEAIAELGPGLVVQEVTAAQEADDEIRRFCREQKSDVLILSNDTSLILGLDDNKYIVSMSRLVLSPKAGHKYPMLFGPALKLGVLCTMWCKCIYKSHFDVGLRGAVIEDLKKPARSSSTASSADGNTNVSPINSESLLLVSCLLEGEYEEYDPNEITNGTGLFLSFLKNYCFPYNCALRSSADRYDKRKLDFIVACTAVMLFARCQIKKAGPVKYDSFEGFEVVLEETKRVAAAVMAQDPAGQSIFDLPRKNNGSFHNVCEKLLGMNVEAVMNVLHRRLALLAKNGEATGHRNPLYYGEWGIWMSCEPVSPGHMTEDILHPFTSLMRQVVVASHCPAVSVEPVESSDASPANFNDYLRRLISVAEVALPVESLSDAEAPSVWASRLLFRPLEESTAFTKTQVFEYVQSNAGVLPTNGILSQQEIPNSASSPLPPSSSASSALTSGTPSPPAPSTYTAYTAPRPLIHWQVLDAAQYCTQELYRHDYGQRALPLCSSHVQWNPSSAGALLNLSERSKILSRLASGELRTSVATETAAAVSSAFVASRVRHPFIETLVEMSPTLPEVSKPIYKFWKKYFSESFDDKDQLKAGSLGAALILHGFANTYDRWARQDGHSYSWTNCSADKIIENITDAVLLAPAFAHFVSKQTAVTDGIDKNLRKSYPQLLSKVPEKSRNFTKQTFRWVEVLQFMVKETLLAGKDVRDSCGRDLFSWFDGIGISVILHLGLKAEAYFPPHQCAALWCEELSAFLGFKESELESAVASLSEARAAVLVEVRK